ncbi:MAG: tetratricopeptide repeat protein [Bacteroidales bacterium]|nr:tetratricopeptide repeat protein [Bacteroidales bacterium]
MMKLQNILHTSFFLCVVLLATAVSAQTPKWFKKARKAQLNIVTYDATGQMLNSTNGFFIGEEGTAVADYAAFKGASRAVAIDFDGKEWPVSCIAGASALYDVVKFRVGVRKSSALKLAAVPAVKGQNAYIMPYLSSKANAATIAVIGKVEKFNERYAYYTLPAQTAERTASCPVLNGDGEVIGLLQLSATGDAEQCFALDVNFINGLQTTAMSATSTDYRDIFIRKALPTTADQANSFIYLTGKRDTSLYLAYVDDYIEAFPEQNNGYTMKAEMLSARHDFTAAETAWEEGLKHATAPDEILYSRARTIYARVQDTPSLPEDWTLERAVKEIDAALAVKPEPVYTAMKAHILYGQKRYAEASLLFVELNKTNMRSAENFLYAAQCQQMLGDTTAILALQDSAVNMFTKPYVTEAAPSLLMRAQTRLDMGKYREAVMDLNDYEHLVRNNLNANFYYQREQAEMNCRMFQQALNDIERAAKMDPKEPLYQAELAAVNYRFNQLDAALIAARAAIALDDRFPDAHRILGLILRQQGKETEAREALQRAIDLGDETAKKILTP